MSSEPLWQKPLVYRPPGTDAIEVHRSESLDIYYPPRPFQEPFPVAVIVLGYPDHGMERLFGRRFKDWAWTTGWARLLSISGVAAVTYSSNDNLRDLQELIARISSGEVSTRLDGCRIGLCATSGHAPTALAMLADSNTAVRCCGLWCPCTMDLDGSTAIAELAARFGFAGGCFERRIEDLRNDAPLLLVRAGADQMPGLNEALDRFANRAVSLDFPLTVVNHRGAPHGFDLLNDSDATRGVIRQILSFMTLHLAVR